MRGADAHSDVDAPPVERFTRAGDLEVPLGDFSHGLLGAFDAVAEPASLALSGVGLAGLLIVLGRRRKAA